ncbi:MAG TPA: hypothetical protein VFB20_13230 [Burkholderiales bacterium]|nr:hypothetical protein [Burkholderiales bacterium]
MALRLPIDVAARVSAELSAIIKSLVNDPTGKSRRRSKTSAPPC